MRKGFFALGTLVALLAMALPAQATVIEHEHYTDSGTDEFTECGFDIRVDYTASGNLRTRTGKHDLDGKVAEQGIAVYGNKGSTDQHAYVQQLRDGVNNFFATLIEVRKARGAAGIEVEPGVNCGDYLQGFLRGTRTALYEGGRDNVTGTTARRALGTGTSSDSSEAASERVSSEGSTSSSRRSLSAHWS